MAWQGGMALRACGWDDMRHTHSSYTYVHAMHPLSHAHVSSEIWLNRRAIKKSVQYSTASPNFDWWLSLKTACYRSPIEFCSIVCSVSVVVFGEWESMCKACEWACGWIMSCDVLWHDVI